MLTLGIVYVVIAVVVTLLVRAADDPYSHFTPTQDWGQAALIGALWAPFLLWAIATVTYYFVRDWLDQRN